MFGHVQRGRVVTNLLQVSSFVSRNRERSVKKCGESDRVVADWYIYKSQFRVSMFLSCTKTEIGTM